MSPVHENAGQIAGVCTKLRELAAISNLKKLTELLIQAEQEAYRIQFEGMVEKTKTRIERKMQDTMFNLCLESEYTSTLPE